jgi:hypothetical protein
VAGVTAASSASTGQLEAVLDDGRAHGSRPPAGERDGRVVGVVDRVGQQHFVAVADDRGQRAGQAERGAGRGQDFGARVVRDAVVARQLGRHRFAEPDLAAVVGIGRAAGPHRRDDRPSPM